MTDIEKIIYDAIRVVAKTDEPEKFAQMNKTVFEVAKTMLESLPKIHGWIARDPHIENPIDQDEIDVNDVIGIYPSKPLERIEDICWNRGADNLPPFILPKEMFPEITWESEPVEVELLIRKIESTKQV